MAKINLDGPGGISEEEKNGILEALKTTGGPSASSGPSTPPDNTFVGVLDQLLSALHLRQKTNIVRPERNGLAAIDAKITHRFNRRGYVRVTLKAYADSFREHSVSIDDTGGKRVTQALSAVGGSPSSNSVYNFVPPQVGTK
jgi:hypothetical protein